MGLHRTAHYLRSKGRGNDTMLVHMTPGEVKGLQALALRHGGSLTINPDTGLPEAGFLEQILPVVAAAGLTYLTAGAAAPVLASSFGLGATASGIAAGALSGALISGGMAAIQGKDAGKAALMGGLGGGVAGGLGAYADAPNLLADISQKTAETAGTQAGQQFAEQAAKASTEAAFNPATGNIATPDVSDVYSGLAGQPTVAPGTMPAGLTTPPPSPPVPTQAGIDAAKLTGQARIDALNKLDPSASAFGEAPGINAEQALYRQENLARPTAVGDIYKPITPQSIKPETTFYQDQGTLGRMAIQGLPVVGLLGDETQTAAGPTDTYKSPLSRISPNFQAYVPPQPDPYYKARYPTYAAEGGIMASYDDEPGSDMAGGGIVAFANQGAVKLPKGDPGIYRDTDPATAKQDAFTAALTRMKSMQGRANIKGLAELKAAAKPLGNVEEAAKGGIMSDLGGYSDGGRMLKGPGDGMSDSIPATIGRKQPARLADGEFVVPADVVSHLGNGSTDAGARKLYKMMDKIRAARTGKKKQAPAVKAEKYIPA